MTKKLIKIIANNTTTTKYLPVITANQKQTLDLELIFGWYKHKQYLIIHHHYHYTCLCGFGYKLLSLLCSHLKQCSFINSLLNEKVSTTKAKEFGCSQPVLIKYNYPHDKEPIISSVKRKSNDLLSETDIFCPIWYRYKI